MGWLEVLVLLKNTLPHLLDLKPMLERVLARAPANDDLQRALADLSSEMRAAAAKSNAATEETLHAHGERLLQVEQELRHLKLLAEENRSIAEANAREIAAMAKLLRSACLVLIILLVVCAGLLIVLVLRRH